MIFARLIVSQHYNPPCSAMSSSDFFGWHNHLLACKMTVNNLIHNWFAINTVRGLKALACRACISGLVPAALLHRRCSHRLLVPAVAALTCIAPATTAVVRLRAELGVATTLATASYLSGAAAGAALTAGVLPLQSCTTFCCFQQT